MNDRRSTIAHDCLGLDSRQDGLGIDSRLDGPSIERRHDGPSSTVELYEGRGRLGQAPGGGWHLYLSAAAIHHVTPTVFLNVGTRRSPAGLWFKFDRHGNHAGLFAR